MNFKRKAIVAVAAMLTAMLIPMSAAAEKGISQIDLGWRDGTVLPVGMTSRVPYTIFPYDAEDTKLTWYSSNPEVASIDVYGTLTAHKAGKTTIRVFSTNKTYANALITVSGSREKDVPAKTLLAKSRYQNLSLYDKYGERLGYTKSLYLFVADEEVNGLVPIYCDDGIYYVKSDRIRVTKSSTPADGYVARAVKKFSLRKSAEADSKVLATVPEGCFVVYLGKTATGDVLLCAMGYTGYASADCIN